MRRDGSRTPRSGSRARRIAQAPGKGREQGMADRTSQKPPPKVSEDNAGFWQSCKEHQMKLQKCDECGKFRYYPSPMCGNCGSFKFQWTPVSGNATVYSFTVVTKPPTP